MSAMDIYPVELAVGNYVYSDNYDGYVTVGVVTKVNPKTYTVRIEYKGWEVHLNRRTLCTKHGDVFLPISGMDAFDRMFDREAYVRRIDKLEARIRNLKLALKNASSLLAKASKEINRYVDAKGQGK